MDFSRLPGGELILQGLGDIAAGRETIPALLVGVGAPRLSRLGIDVAVLTGAEHRLYARLAEEDALAAHSRYNALLRRLISFERAAECAH